MFTVNLYEMNKRENSTQRPSGNGYVINCEAHEPIDLMSPTFLINLSAPFDYNYLYISIWDRYYWIDNWTYNKGLWEAACSIDPLASWRNDIGNMTEYVLRSSDEFDGGIVDTTYPLTGEVDIVQNFATWSVEANPSGCYVIGVVGAQGLTEYYWINDYEIDDFGAAMFGNTLWTNIVADDPGVQQGGVPSFMKAQFNPLQYVVSCMWFPFALPHAGSKSHVYFGYFDSGWGAYKLTRDSFNLFSDNIRLNEHPQADARGYYLDLAPYSRLRLSALPWGEIDLDTTKFFGVNSVIYLEAWVDPVTGSTKLYVMNGAGDTLITLVGQIGVPEQLSQVLKDNLATVTGGLSALAGAASAMAGNVMGGLATVASGIGNAISAQYPDVSTTGTNGARIAVAPTNIYVTQTFQHIVEEDRQNHGRPLCQRRRLNTLPGYLMVSDPDVEIPATKAEIQKIKEYMVNGFFYE